MYAGDVEIEGNHRNQLEEILDEAVGTRARHGTFEPVDAVEQLGCGDRRHRDLFVVAFAMERRGIEPASFHRDEDAGVDQRAHGLRRTRRLL
jgi:hypothetical protein